MGFKNKCLTKKDITKLGFHSMFLQASFNFERMQACGWLCALSPSLKKIYKDDKEKLSGAMKDNLEFINTHPNFAGFLMGLLISLEENKESRETISGLKNGLFGPLAGIGDAIFWFTLLPIVVGISSSFALQGSLIGPLLFFLVYLFIFAMRIPLTHLGYRIGINGISVIQRNSEKIAKSATILGITVIGGLIASYISIDVLSTIDIGEGIKVSLQSDFFDKILPNLLPALYVGMIYFLLKKKNMKPVSLILLTFILVFILSFFGIL